MTTTDLAVQTNSPVATAEQNTAIGQLMQHAQAMQAAFDLATKLSNTSMVPALYRGKADDATAAILYGAELGLNPIQSLQQIFVVQGKPAIYARTMVALLKSKGHEVWTEETADDAVTVCGRMRGTDHVERSTWSIDRAKKAGYTSNAKYQTDPQAMLYAKAASEVCRKIAPDILLGIGYSREELELEPQPVRVKSERVGNGTTGLRGALGMNKPVDVSDLPEAEPDAASSESAKLDTPQVEEEPKITTPQLKKLHAMLGEVGLGGATKRDEALAWMSNVLERAEDAPLTSSKDLRATEADHIFAELDKAIEGQS